MGVVSRTYYNPLRMRSRVTAVCSCVCVSVCSLVPRPSLKGPGDEASLSVIALVARALTFAV